MTSTDIEIDDAQSATSPLGDGGEALPAPSMRSQVVSGSAWTVAGFGVMQVLRLGSNVVLTHLLFPEAFGLMAILMAVMFGLEMFSDVGIRASIIQNKRSRDATFLNTAWTIQVIRGFGLWAAACVIAWPAAWFYEEPALGPLIAVAGVMTVVRGFGSTSLITLNRDLALKALIKLDVIAKIIAIVVMISWAAVVPTVWALVGGVIAEQTFRTIGSHWWLRDNADRFAWNRDAVHELFHFGKWIFLSTLAVYLALNADRLVLGKLVTTDVLGIYSIALMFARVIDQLAMTLDSRVVFPMLALRQHDPQGMVRTFMRMRHIVLGAGAGACAALVLGAPMFFNEVYDDRYADAGRFAQWLAILTWANVVAMGVPRVPLALGQSRILFVINVAKLSSIPLSIAGFYMFGPEGFIVGLALGTMLAHLFAISRLPCLRMQVLGQSAAYTLLGGAGSGLLLWFLTLITSRLDRGGVIASTILLGALPCLAAAWAVYRGLLRRRSGPPAGAGGTTSLRFPEGVLWNDPVIEKQWRERLEQELADAPLEVGRIAPLEAIELQPDEHHVEDYVSKLLIRSPLGKPVAVALCASPSAPDLVAEGMARAREAKAALAPDLGRVILDPIWEGRLDGQSGAVLPYCRALKSDKLLGRWQRRVVKANVLDWLAEVTRATARPCHDEDIHEAFVVPLELIESREDLPERLRREAGAALDRLQSGAWRPLHVLAHNDFSIENTLIDDSGVTGRKDRPWRERFVIIDWPGSSLNGYPMMDLLRIAYGLPLGPRDLQREIVRHCEFLQCDRADARSNLLAGSGEQLMHLGHFPLPAFIDTTMRRLGKLDRIGV